MRTLSLLLFVTLVGAAAVGAQTPVQVEELPNATAPADNESNATPITRLGVMLFCFDGSTWDRCPGNATDGLLVNLGANNDVTVSGTVTANAGTNLNTSALLTTTAHDNAFGTAGVADAQVRTVQGIASGTPVIVGDGAGALNVIVDSSALPSGAATSASQLPDGHNVTVDNAAAGAAVNIQDGGNTITVDGTVTVSGTVAISQTTTDNDVDVATIAAGDNNIGNVDIVTMPNVTIGTFPDNEPINVAQMNGVAVTMGNGVSGTGVQRVTIASDSTGQVAVASLPNEGQQTAANSISVTPDTDNDSIGATGAAPPGEATYAGGLTSGATGGFLAGIPICDGSQAVDIVTATTTLVVTGVSGRHVRVCAINLVTAAANNVAVISGTGATCGTGTTGINGGTTAAEGWNFAANGGIAQGSGLGTIMRTTSAGDSVCIVTSAATQLSGTVSYTIY